MNFNSTHTVGFRRPNVSALRAAWCPPCAAKNRALRPVTQRDARKWALRCANCGEPIAAVPVEKRVPR